MMGMLMTIFLGTGHLTKRLQLQLVLLIPTVQHFFISKKANRPRLGWGSACSPPFSANVCALKISALTCKSTHFSHTLVIKPVERRTFFCLRDSPVLKHFMIPRIPRIIVGAFVCIFIYHTHRFSWPVYDSKVSGSKRLLYITSPKPVWFL